MIKNISWKKILEQDLDYVGDELREHLEESKACIIFSGEVGAGKTTFIQHLMKSNSTEKNILSPTYSLINEQGEFAHADFYRIDDPEEIIHLEMGLYAEGKNFFLIEWGLPFLKEIRSQLGEQFKYYELKIEVNAGDDPISSSRNMILSPL